MASNIVIWLHTPLFSHRIRVIKNVEEFVGWLVDLFIYYYYFLNHGVIIFIFTYFEYLAFHFHANI